MNGNIEYYEIGSSVITCVHSGLGWMFRGSLDITHTEEWVFIRPCSIAWDSLHRNIYEGNHDFDMCTAEEIAKLSAL